MDYLVHVLEILIIYVIFNIWVTYLRYFDANERGELNFGEAHNDSFVMWSIIVKVDQRLLVGKNEIFKQNNLKMTMHLLCNLWLKDWVRILYPKAMFDRDRICLTFIQLLYDFIPYNACEMFVIQ